MFLAFIAGVVIGGLIGAALVYSYEIRVLRGFRQRVEKIELDYSALLEAEENNKHEEN